MKTGNRGLLVLLVLTGCAGTGTQPLAPVPVEDRSVAGNAGSPQAADGIPHSPHPADPREAAPDAARFPQQPVLAALSEEAGARSKAGDEEGAAAALERALRLDSKNPLLWYRLGQVRLRQKNWQQAVHLARKSISLARDDNALMIANWHLIRAAHAGEGDHDAEREASEQIRRLTQGS